MQHSGSSLQEVINQVAYRIRISCNSNITHEDIFAHLLAGRPLSTITPQLAAFGVLSADERQSYLNSCDKIRDVCESSLRKKLSKAGITQEEVRMINGVLCASSAQTAPLDTQKLLSDLGISNPKSTLTGSSNLVKGKKPVFNHEYTPLLDKYFEYNAYPSAPDRAVLARKSMMTQRQIEVWFQNHRNRAKKEGRALRRLADAALPAELSLRSLERKMPFFTIPVHERKPGKSKAVRTDVLDSKDNSVTPVSPQEIPSADLLNPPQPLHAFPAIYSKPCSYIPFANRVNKDDFPPPIWPRKYAVPHPSTIKNSIDMHGLIMDFTQKLHLRTPAPRKERFKATPSWCAARVTIASPAPHPALVRTYVPIPIPDLSRPLPAVASPTSSHRALQSPNLTPQSTTFAPNGGRKVAPLPRRRPISVTRHCSGSPVTDDSSSAFQSSSSTSSPPYLGPYSGSRRRVSSSSSSSSSSSGPSTPVQLEATLSEDDFSPIVTSGLDSNASIQFGIRGLGALVEQVSSSVFKKVPEGICPPLQRRTLRFAP